MKILAYISNNSIQMLLALLVSSLLAGCHTINEGEGDCSTTYRVKFVYDKNMKYADAFAHEVKSVSLYVLDEDGKLVWQGSEQGEALAAADYTMEVGVPAACKDYDLIAWCGLKEGGTFSVPTVQVGDSKEKLTCTLRRTYDAAGQACVNEEVTPLYYGFQMQSFCSEEGVHTYTVPLTKNTNAVRIALQHLSGSPVEKNQYTFTITDENGRMDWNNELLDDEPLTYYPWRIDSGSAVLEGASTRDDVVLNTAVAEFTVGRLVLGHHPRLTVTNQRGETIFSIPLIDYALLVKGYYNRDMDDQEYLDRQDEYNMVFFLDENDRWMNAYIYINSWKVVLQNADI